MRILIAALLVLAAPVLVFAQCECPPTPTPTATPTATPTPTGTPILPASVGRFQSSIIMVAQNPATPFAANSTDTYAFGGSALTAQTETFFSNYGFRSVYVARWILVWTPRTAYGSCRLVQMNDGPSNIEELVQLWPVGDPTGPQVGAVLTTVYLNDLITSGVYKHIGTQCRGDGATGPLIYSSRLDIVWN